MSEQPADVVAVGEVMGLLDPDADGPLEDVRRFTLRVAGAEANVLITLARLGLRTALVSAVGTDPVGRLVLRTLAEQGVGTGHVHQVDRAPTGIFLKERFADGERRVYYYRDGSAAASLTPAEVGLDTVPAARFLVVSGLSLGLGRPGGLAAVARDALARYSAAGATVVFDPNLRPGLWDGPAAARDFAEVRAHVDLLLTGRDELAALTGTDPDEAARQLCADGMRAVVVKDGARGASVHDRSGVTTIAPFPVDRVVDPVGAGDAFCAGLVAGLLRGWPLIDAARLGAVFGAAAVTAVGDWEAVPVTEPPEDLLARYERAVRVEEARP